MHEVTQQLMLEVFPQHKKYLVSEFLNWEYDQSPSGSVIEANYDSGGKRLGHYAVVPQRWLFKGEVCRYGLSINNAVSEETRGQGVFAKLGQEVSDKSAKHDLKALIGVSNSQATYGQVNRIGFKQFEAMPVFLVPRFLSISNSDYRFDFCDLDEFTTWVENSNFFEISDLDRGASHTPVRLWDESELLWRLSDPSHNYVMMISESVALIVHNISFLSVQVSVILKIFVDTSLEPVDLRFLASQICRQNRSLFVLYAGWNPLIIGKGIKIHSSLRPSPLNLIIKSLSPNTDETLLRPDWYEFLDFDAY